MYQLRILQKAKEDMQKSAAWYNREQMGVGDKFLLQVVRSFRNIETNPLQYEEKFSKKFRFGIVTNFPYVIVFKVKNESLIINAIFHTSRNPKKYR